MLNFIVSTGLFTEVEYVHDLEISGFVIMTLKAIFEQRGAQFFSITGTLVRLYSKNCTNWKTGACETAHKNASDNLSSIK
jgi:hypothetical protein